MAVWSHTWVEGWRIVLGLADGFGGELGRGISWVRERLVGWSVFTPSEVLLNGVYSANIISFSSAQSHGSMITTCYLDVCVCMAENGKEDRQILFYGEGDEWNELKWM